MTQPGHLPTFVLKLQRDESALPFSATCLIENRRDAEGFHAAVRRFGSEQELAAALKHAGLTGERYQGAISKIGSGSASFEIDQNEGQRLGILHTDTPE